MSGLDWKPPGPFALVLSCARPTALGSSNWPTVPGPGQGGPCECGTVVYRMGRPVNRTNVYDVGAAIGFGVGALLSLKVGLVVLALVVGCGAYYVFLRWTGVIGSRRAAGIETKWLFRIFQRAWRTRDASRPR